MPEAVEYHLPQHPSRKEFHNFGNGEVETLRITPNTIRKDESTGQSVIPLLFLQGHGRDGTLESYLQGFADQDQRETCGVTYPGKRDSTKTRLVHVEGLKNKVPQYELDRAQDLIKGMEAMGLEKVDMVATSEGAIRAMICAALYPDKFRDILLVHPSGMDDRGRITTYARVALHYGRELLRPRKALRKLKGTESGKQRIGIKGYFQKGLREVHAGQMSVASAKVHSLLPQVTSSTEIMQDLTGKILVSMIGDKHDRIYPPGRLREVNGKYLFEFIESDWGGHGMGARPERIGQAVSMLGKMERSRKLT